MLHTHPRFAEAVEQAVGEIERHTDAEIVVVAAERSGHYRDLAYLGGFAIAAGSLALLMVVPWDIHPVTVFVEVVAGFALAAWVLNGRSFVRLIAPRARKDRQVAEAMAHEFHRENVHATPNRTGVLVYVSALEHRVDLLLDLGIRGRVPDGRWAGVRETLAHDDLDHFLQGLEAAGVILAEHVPKLEVDEVDLPNAPRVRR